MINKVIIVGRLGKDPEIRYTSGGQAVANFSVATDETWKDRAGEKQTRTEWHRIQAWGKLAEICQQYLKKGALVYIEGKLRTNEWTDRQSGDKRQRQEVVCETMKMLGPKNGALSAGESGDAVPSAAEDIPY